MGKNVSKSSLARANQDRDYHIFEEYAYYLVNEIRKSGLLIFSKLVVTLMLFIRRQLIIAFSLLQAKLGKKKDGFKAYTLYDVETQIPVFFHITEASVHDSKAMNGIPYESGSYYIFDRDYNNFKIVISDSSDGVYFIVRALKNLG